jgi:Mg-chelatase subunit ChlD
LNRLQSVPVTARTDIGEAINLGLALLPAQTQKRMVLLSDGGDNAGEVQTALELARARNIPIDVVELGESTNDIVQLSDLRAPSAVRKGQTIPLQVVIESQTTTEATLRVRSGSQIIAEQRVTLQEGRQTFEFPVEADADGFARYTAEIEVDGDTRTQNNQAAALVNVEGEPRVLLVEGNGGEAQNLQAALQAAQMNPTVVAPGDVPTGLAELGSYDAVVLVNVAAPQMSNTAMEQLASSVRDLGKGLVMIGGDRSYGVGGYTDTPVEAALPVDMEVKDKTRRPDIALVFVIDKSGSMDACHCDDPNGGMGPGGGPVKVNIAKEAVLQASVLLQPDDQLGVVAFDGSAHWALNINKVPSIDEVQQAVSGIQPDGNTNVRGGLLAAKDALENTDAKVKHVILLTDGWSNGADNSDIADELRAEGITLSTVAAGSGSAPYLEDLADKGGGRYYPVQNMEDVPQIFVEETIKTVGSYIIEEQFVPTLVGDSAILNGLADIGWPSLYGYNGTQPKDSAQVVLRAPLGDPVLAQWQYGLGRAVAWTSDAKGQWGRDLVQWQEFGTFAAQLVSWTVPRGTPNALNAQARIEGTQAIVTAETTRDGQPLTDATVSATVVGDDGVGEPTELRQVGPGQFQATLPSPQRGSYLLQLSAQQNGQAIGQQLIGLVVPYSPEYRQGQSNPVLLQAVANATGGRPIETPAAAFEHNLAAVRRAQEISLPLLLLATLLLPLDIAVRRLSLRRRDWAEARAWVAARTGRKGSTAAAPSAAMRDLQRAKALAALRTNRPADPTSPNAAQPAQTASTAAPPSVPRRPAPVVERPSAAQTEQAVPTPQPPAAPAPATDDDPLARLRAAKERARRR